MTGSDWINTVAAGAAIAAIVWALVREYQHRAHIGGTVDVERTPIEERFMFHKGGPLPPTPRVTDWSFVVIGRGTSNLWDLEVRIIAGTAQGELPGTRSLTPNTALPSFVVRADSNDRIAFEVRARQSRRAKVKTIETIELRMEE